jgi:hypothetical protein
MGPRTDVDVIFWCRIVVDTVGDSCGIVYRAATWKKSEGGKSESFFSKYDDKSVIKIILVGCTCLVL